MLLLLNTSQATQWSNTTQSLQFPSLFSFAQPALLWLQKQDKGARTHWIWNTTPRQPTSNDLSNFESQDMMIATLGQCVWLIEDELDSGLQWSHQTLYLSARTWPLPGPNRAIVPEFEYDVYLRLLSAVLPAQMDVQDSHPTDLSHHIRYTLQIVLSRVD